MPHVIVKLQAGRSEQQKAALAEAMTKAIVETLRSAEGSVSVAIEDVQPGNGTEQVYKPDIVAKPETIYKKPGYDPR
jgi:4-oxalocrotonate tautomerase